MKEALRLALVALKTIDDAMPFPVAKLAIKECTAALEAKDEPVAWMVYTQDGQSVYVTDNPTDIQEGQRALPLYTKAQHD
jgi:hypothetical protein